MDSLDGIARRAAGQFPDLPPNGGFRWTQEDLEAAISTLFEIMKSKAFEEALQRGMTFQQTRSYLYKALTHRLLKDASRRRRLKLLDDAVIDTLPNEKPGMLGVYPEDAVAWAADVLNLLTRSERSVLVGRLLRQASPQNEPMRGELGGFPSRATCTRRLAHITAILRRLVQEREIGREELTAVIKSLVSLSLRGQPADLFSQRPTPGED